MYVGQKEDWISMPIQYYLLPGLYKAQLYTYFLILLKYS